MMKKVSLLYTCVLILFFSSNAIGQERTPNRTINSNLKSGSSGQIQVPVTPHQNGQSEETVVPIQTPIEVPFTPIEATGYTDPNYQINLDKSTAQQSILDNPTPIVQPVTLSKEARLQKYVFERDKYSADSYEYSVIQEKINKLLAAE